MLSVGWFAISGDSPITSKLGNGSHVLSELLRVSHDARTGLLLELQRKLSPALPMAPHCNRQRRIRANCGSAEDSAQRIASRRAKARKHIRRCTDCLVSNHRARVANFPFPVPRLGGKLGQVVSLYARALSLAPGTHAEAHTAAGREDAEAPLVCVRVMPYGSTPCASPPSPNPFNRERIAFGVRSFSTLLTRFAAPSP